MTATAPLSAPYSNEAVEALKTRLDNVAQRYERNQKHPLIKHAVYVNLVGVLGALVLLKGTSWPSMIQQSPYLLCLVAAGAVGLGMYRRKQNDLAHDLKTRLRQMPTDKALAQHGEILTRDGDNMNYLKIFAKPATWLAYGGAALATAFFHAVFWVHNAAYQGLASTSLTVAAMALGMTLFFAHKRVGSAKSAQKLLREWKSEFKPA